MITKHICKKLIHAYICKNTFPLFTYICFVSFLYPVFLLAGLSLAIPVIIHLFNLRRYKTVFFPHTRFLKSIQLHSRKQSQVRYKLLLTLRLLFLASLILAFAQPLWNNNRKETSNTALQTIYIDNSYSMSVKRGAFSLLETALSEAAKHIRNAPSYTKFVILSNDKAGGAQPVTADKALTALTSIGISPAKRTPAHVLSLVQSILHNEGATSADLYYYSDFQKSACAATPDVALWKNINFYGVALQQQEAANVYVDTAYLAVPVLQSGQNNQLIVHTKAVGAVPKDAPVLQFAINGQVKSAASVSFSSKGESLDTFSFQMNDAGWQKLAVYVNDASVRFDDTFRIAARNTPSLSVLVLNEGNSNPFIQAAFRSYNGFRLLQTDINSSPQDWKPFNLIVYNGITHLDATQGMRLADALEAGQSICIFPGRTNNFSAINEGLKLLGDLQIKGLDTTVQTATSLQQGNDLVKDLFEKIPENVQLPTAKWHYTIQAGLNANQQSVISFRNGDPLFVGYKPSKGLLYISSSGADAAAGNFQSSYFFAPFLYRMTVQAHGSDVHAVTAGKHEAAYLQYNNAGERNMVHMYGTGIDAIPPQQPQGAGLNVYVDAVTQQSGFYTLAAPASDTTQVALNADRAESNLAVYKPEELTQIWKDGHVKWLSATTSANSYTNAVTERFPLWKVCVILAVLMLLAETYVLTGSIRKSSLAA